MTSGKKNPQLNDTPSDMVRPGHGEVVRETPPQKNHWGASWLGLNWEGKRYIRDSYSRTSRAIARY